MKTIILFRHGKSDWDADYDADHDRPLASRGRQAAAKMGRALSNMGQVPDRVLTSSARRACDTVTLAAQAGNWGAPIDVVPEFYASSPEEVIARVRLEDDAADILLIAGHEPTWSELVSELISGGVLRFPTAAMARIDLHVDSWNEVAPCTGSLTWFLIPRLLEAL